MAPARPSTTSPTKRRSRRIRAIAYVIIWLLVMADAWLISHWLSHR